MTPERIYEIFKYKCYGLKDEVRQFKSNDNTSIILFMKDMGRPLLFRVIDSTKGYWKLGPYTGKGDD